jgi:hypothetical protein
MELNELEEPSKKKILGDLYEQQRLSLSRILNRSLASSF